MEECKKGGSLDVALLYAATDDGKGARVLRSRDGTLETGEVRPAIDGKPIQHGELLRLSPRADAPCVCDVEVLHATAPQAPSDNDEAVSAARGRPAQVASDDYRLNWDRIFGMPGRRTRRDRSFN
jgi:hypothetical protein